MCSMFLRLYSEVQHQRFSAIYLEKLNNGRVFCFVRLEANICFLSGLSGEGEAMNNNSIDSVLFLLVPIPLVFIS